ncbi:MAG: 30S ribosomal protein S12 methylthiotransferase RimO [Ignavibacteria bacterium]
MKIKSSKIKIITLGCAKNIVDSEFLSHQLKNGGIELTQDEKNCDAVIINTCGFIEQAKEESINTILKAIENKKKNRVKKVYVAGCLSERYMAELRKEIPEVDHYFGSTDKPGTLVNLLQEIGIDYKKELLGERELLTPNHYAYLKISEGCDNPCSFCAIPIMRGKHKSKPLEEILNECALLQQKGVKELVLIAQDTTYWGMDIYGKKSLPFLIEKISGIGLFKWIRLMYAYPARFPDKVIEVIASKDNLCKYIDIPIQHISDDILKSMRRGTTKKSIIQLLESLRNRIPGVAIRTTLLVGYPGETEKHFTELLNFIKDFKFDRLGVFTYSHEDSTYAYQSEDNVPYKEKLLRQKIILDTQKLIATERNRELVGETCDVLIDKKVGDYYIGRTYRDAPEIDQNVFIQSNTKLNIGEFYQTKIFDHEEFDLFGEVVN